MKLWSRWLLVVLSIGLLMSFAMAEGSWLDGLKISGSYRLRGDMFSTMFKEKNFEENKVEMLRITDADSSIIQRAIDQRFVTTFSYRASKFISATIKWEIGDLQWGNNPGADLGTDGINVETKHAYLDITPNENLGIRVGLQAYADFANSWILDDDMPAIMIRYKKDNFDASAGVITLTDGGETLDNSYGQNIYALRGRLHLREKMAIKAEVLANMRVTYNDYTHTYITDITPNVNDSTIMDTTTVDTVLHYVEKNNDLYFTIGFCGKFGMFSTKTSLIIGSYKTSYEALTDTALSLPEETTNTGMAIASYNTIKINDKMSTNINFFYATGDSKGEKSYHGISTYTITGLEIMGAGVVDRYGMSPYGIYGLSGGHGLMMFVGAFNMAMNEKIGLKAALGYAMASDSDVDEKALGFEFDLGMTYKLAKNLKLVGVFGYYMPGKFFGEDLEGNMEVATQLKYSF